MRFLKGLFVFTLFVVIGLGAFAFYAWHREIDPVERVDAADFDPALVRRGAELAAIGNCNVCHTAPGGAPFAGGRALPTPFGTIHATNITPDPETGIGRWSEAAFQRAMREGVDRQGRHLYPAFPYDHFTRVTDEDNRAIYAYLMTRDPIRADTPGNDLPFPLNVRMVVAGWKLLHFDEGAFEPDPARSEAWNRGAYLAEGLGHCGACHTPRNMLGAEDNERRYAGAEIEGWHAYALDASSPAPVPWTAATLAFYLRHGWEERHGVSRGPMAPVTANLSTVPEEDVAALAAYVASAMGNETATDGAPEETSATATAPSGDSQAATSAAGGAGAAIYAAACATCHEAGRPVPFGGLDLGQSTALHGPNAQNLINVTLFGLPAAEGAPSPVMPGFRGALGEDQMVALVDYMRERFGGGPEWIDTRERVRAVLSGEKPVAIYRSDGEGRAPADVGQEEVTW